MSLKKSLKKSLYEFQSLSSKHEIKTQKESMQNIFDKIKFYFNDNNNKISDEILDLKNESKILIIEYYEADNDKYFFICFDYQLIIIKGNQELLPSILSKHQDSAKYFLNPNPISEIKIEEADIIFNTEIDHFIKNFLIDANQNLIDFWNKVVKCISGFLIKKSYKNSKLSYDERSQKKLLESQEKIDSYNEKFFDLRIIGNGGSASVELIYYINEEKVFALKSPYSDKIDLIERERRNYLQIQHFFIVKYYGYIEKYGVKCLLLEYVEGEMLDQYDVKNLEFDDKLAIILELMLSIYQIHSYECIYRDLHYKNIIINEDKYAILIDFDRVVNINEQNTNDFCLIDVPELGQKLSYKADVYLLGKIIHFIIEGTNKITENQAKESLFYKSCLCTDPDKRPTMSELINAFFVYLNYQSVEIKNMRKIRILSKSKLLETFSIGETFSIVQIFSIEQTFSIGQKNNKNVDFPFDISKAIHYYSSEENQNNSDAQFFLGYIYCGSLCVLRDIDKAIHYLSLAANQNDSKAQNTLGIIYYEGKYVSRDIDKAIHYLSLAANQNNPHAQFSLGFIYHKSEYVLHDINKAIYYYSFAANQNNSDAQFYLGSFYYDGIYIPRDIKKAIYYFTLAANHNDSDAQFYLGSIYYDGIYIPRDINKAIHYLTLSANQNNSYAQYCLGSFYYLGIYVPRDINKAVHYLTLAVNQNNPHAQFYLGFIYYLGIYVPHDINKAIHYLTLAANYNNPDSQCYLGLIYYKGEYVSCNIDKAIHYLTLAANQNNSNAQYNLGLIYYDGKNVSRDINKAIHYLTLAANQNDSVAQNNLGYIYYEGKYVSRDINKAIHYLTLSANQNDSHAQKNLGFIYYSGIYFPRNINKTIYYLTLAANQNDIDAQFILGCIYYEGLFVDYDIEKAIHFFKEASCFNHSQAKNNLGIIYKTGKGVKANPSASIIYFEEAIRQKGDKIAMFNLAHIYFYEEAGISNLDLAIELLINSISGDNECSIVLLCLATVKKYQKLNKSEIIKDFEKIDKEHGYSKAMKLLNTIKKYRLKEQIYYEQMYFFLKKINLVYYGQKIENQTHKKKKEIIDRRPKINSLFYEGLGDIIT